MITRTLLTNKTCGPCRVIKNKLMDLKLEVNTLDFSDPETHEFFSKHGIRSVPRLVVEDDENGVNIIQGIDDIIAEIQKE